MNDNFFVYQNYETFNKVYDKEAKDKKKNKDKKRKSEKPKVKNINKKSFDEDEGNLRKN